MLYLSCKLLTRSDYFVSFVVFEGMVESTPIHLHRFPVIQFHSQMLARPCIWCTITTPRWSLIWPRLSILSLVVCILGFLRMLLRQNNPGCMHRKSCNFHRYSQTATRHHLRQACWGRKIVPKCRRRRDPRTRNHPKRFPNHNPMNKWDKMWGTRKSVQIDVFEIKPLDKSQAWYNGLTQYSSS